MSVSTGSVAARRGPRPPDVMDPDCEAELLAEGLHVDLVRWMMANCGTPARFANFIDNKAEAQEHILDQVPAVNENRSQRAAVVARWRKQASEASGESCKLAWARRHIVVGCASDPSDSGYSSAHLPTACGGAPCFGVLDQRSAV